MHKVRLVVSVGAAHAEFITSECARGEYVTQSEFIRRLITDEMARRQQSGAARDRARADLAAQRAQEKARLAQERAQEKAQRAQEKAARLELAADIRETARYERRWAAARKPEALRKLMWYVDSRAGYLQLPLGPNGRRRRASWSEAQTYFRRIAEQHYDNPEEQARMLALVEYCEQASRALFYSKGVLDQRRIWAAPLLSDENGTGDALDDAYLASQQQNI